MKLIIHIGAKKTGTTTLQKALKRYPAELQKQGFHISSIAGSVEDRAFTDAYWRKPEMHEVTHKWFERAKASVADGCHTAIITAEALSDLRLDEIEAFHRDVAERFSSIRVVFYIRRQDLAAVSHFSTALKGGGTSKELLSRSMGDRGRRGFSYGRVAMDWANVFGKEAMRVRRYVDKDKSWNVIADFCGQIDLTPFDALLDFAPQNTRLSRNGAAYLRQFNIEQGKKGSLTARGRFQKVLNDFSDNARIPLPARDEAEKFYATFAEENALLKTEFFPGEDKLFSDDFSMYPIEAEDLDAYANPETYREILKAYEQLKAKVSNA